MAGLIVGILFVLFSVNNTHNGLKMSEYKAYWLTGFPLIKLLGTCQEIIIIIFKKETNKYKEKLVILQSIGII